MVQCRAEELAEGEFEIDILIPRKAVQNELGRLGAELERLQELIQPFVELSTSSRPAIEIRAIGSSDFTVFLAAAPVAAACLAKGIEKVLDIYKRVIDIRLVKAQIEALELPEADETIEASAGPLEDYAGSLMAREVETVASDLVSEYPHDGLPNGRSNELEIEIRRSLTEFAGRIDDQYNISVRTGPVPEIELDGDEEVDPRQQDVARLARQVAAISQNLQFMNLTGSPILRLGDGESETPSPDGSE